MADGAKLATGWLELVVSTQGAQKQITDEVVPAAERAGDAGGRSLGSKMVGAAAAFAAPLAAAAGIGAVIKTGFDEVKDAAAGTAQLAAGIASTGNAANVSVEGLNNLASSIQHTTGQTDDSIVAAESLLLTFSNIRNVGPDKIFDQATQAAADMAARMGGDASSNAILLGKALNDPVKGITALTRVGVSFTQQQKDQIGAMVQAGDVLGAQKVILGELNKEFGGSAAAYGKTLPGQIDILKRSFEDFSQTAIGAVTPLLGPVLGALSAGLQHATEFAENFAGKATAAFTGVVAILGKGDFTAAFREATGLQEDSGVVNVLFGIRDAFLQVQKQVGPIISQLFAAIGPILSQVGAAFAPLIPQIIQLWSSFSPLSLILKAVTPLLPQLAGAFGQLASTIGGALGAALTTLLPVFTQLTGVIAGALGQALSAILPVVTAVVGMLGPILSTILTALLPIITTLAGLFGQLVSAVVPLLAPILALIAPLVQLVGAILTPLIQLFAALLTPILQLVSPIIGLLVPALQAIVNVLTVVIQWIVQAITWFVQLVTGNQQAGAQMQAVWKAVMGFFGGIGQFFASIWNGIISGISGFIGQVVGFFQSIPAKIIAVFAGAGSWLLDVGRNMIQGLLDGAGALLKNIGNFFLSIIPGWIVGPFKAALGIHSPSRVFMGLGENITQGLLNGVNSGQSAIDSTMRSLVSVPSVMSAAAAGIGGASFPNQVTLVDRDGALLGLMDVRIGQSQSDTATSLSTGRQRIV